MRDEPAEQLACRASGTNNRPAGLRIVVNPIFAHVKTWAVALVLLLVAPVAVAGLSGFCEVVPGTPEQCHSQPCALTDAATTRLSAIAAPRSQPNTDAPPNDSPAAGALAEPTISSRQLPAAAFRSSTHLEVPIPIRLRSFLS